MSLTTGDFVPRGSTKDLAVKNSLVDYFVDLVGLAVHIIIQIRKQECQLH